MLIRFKRYFIDTNIWVALCFSALLAYFQLILYVPNFFVLGIVFFGTLAVYNFSRIGGLHKIISFDKKVRRQLILTLIGMIGTLVFVILRGFELKTFLYLFVLGFVSFCYSLPFSNLGLRAIPFFKLFLIAFVWAGSSIGLLTIVHHTFLEYQRLFFSVFFFVVGITIPFDIRDVTVDDKELRTIPQVMGVSRAKAISVLSLLVSAVLFYWEFKVFDEIMISWLISISLALILVLNSSEKRTETYYSLWMEGCSMLPLLFILMI